MHEPTSDSTNEQRIALRVLATEQRIALSACMNQSTIEQRIALRVLATALASGSGEVREALLVPDHNAAPDALALYRSTFDSDALSEYDCELRVLVTEQFAIAETLHRSLQSLIDGRNLLLRRRSTAAGRPRSLQSPGGEENIQAPQRVVKASSDVPARVASITVAAPAARAPTALAARSQLPLPRKVVVDTHCLLNITVDGFMYLMLNPMAWHSSHDSPVDCSIRALLTLYKCAHTPHLCKCKQAQMLFCMSKSLLKSVVLINEQSYKFTNASKVLLNTPRNDIPASFMQEKLFNKVEQTQ